MPPLSVRPAPREKASLSLDAKTGVCAHCGASTPRGERYCCKGCATLSAVLRGDTELPPDLLELDSPEIRSLYVTPPQATPHLDQAQFFLPQVGCVSCLSHLEGLSAQIPEVVATRVDAGRGTLTVTGTRAMRLSLISAHLAAIGLDSHPLRPSENDDARRKQTRLTSAQLAVAGFASGNIMLLSISSYGGASPRLDYLFSLLSGVLFLPVLLFSARPYFVGALSSLSMRKLSIDVPMALAIGGGGLLSYVNLLPGLRGPIYFDSLAMLVFLLQVSRLMLKVAESRAATAVENARSMVPLRARRWSTEQGRFLPVDVSKLRPGDLILVRKGETLPADATLSPRSASDAWFSTAVLTGEPAPRLFRVGDSVPAGAVQESDSETVFQVVHAGRNTALSRILARAEDLTAARPPFLAFTDRVAQAFTAVVIASAVILFFTAGAALGWSEALNRTLALFAVSCPCALALAAPLAFSRGLERAAKDGVLIKSASVLEKLLHIRHIYLDKTGTLTQGTFELRDVEFLTQQASPEFLWQVTGALETGASHPVAKALLNEAARHPAPKEPLKLEDWKEQAGRGVSGRFQGSLWELEAAPAQPTPLRAGQTAVALKRDGKILAIFRLGDQIHPDAKETVRKLSALGTSVYLLSGDNPAATLAVAQTVGIEAGHVHGGYSPEEKARQLTLDSGLRGQTLMAGDGVNDTAALGAAHVGVALRGGLDASLKAADAYVAKNGVAALPRLITTARQVRTALVASFTISLLYNVIASGAAILGWVGPLFAAVLMPINSFIVMSIALTAGRRIRA